MVLEKGGGGIPIDLFCRCSLSRGTAVILIFPDSLFFPIHNFFYFSSTSKVSVVQYFEQMYER